MEKHCLRSHGVFLAALGLVLSLSVPVTRAAEKAPEPAAPQASAPAVPGKSDESVAMPDGQNVEKLLYTLNDTLQENRKIRQSMRDLQTAFEKVTLEKSDLAEQVRKVEQLAIQRNKEIGKKNEDLGAQLADSKKAMAKLESENKISAEQKLELEKKLEAIRADNADMQELLKTAILTPERDRIVERMRSNDAAVQGTVEQISTLSSENVALKKQLIQSYFELGNMFYDLGRYQDAETQYLQVLEWDPYHAWSHYNLAVIYDYHLHKIPQATEHYKEYLRVKLPDEEAREARMRLWDLLQLSKVTPSQPLKQDFDRYQKMPQS